jgi:transglutaminase-like putative cysteine protease
LLNIRHFHPMIDITYKCQISFYTNFKSFAGGINMDLVIVTKDLSSYLEETEIINYYHPSIQQQLEIFRGKAETKWEAAQMAFDFVRDEIQHSFDINGKKVTITASETLELKEGICYAKAHLLAAFLRALDIPCGFYYQKVTRKGTIESGYALHGLNAIYLETSDQWIRLDPRGNKPGIYSEFNLAEEKLAYTLHPELGEEDLPYVYSAPLDSVIQSMKNSKDCNALFYNRPETI